MLRRSLITALVVVIHLLLFGLPWWVTVVAADWPTAATIAGTVVFVLALVSFPALMAAGHLRGHSDAAARVGDTLLGVIWLLFTWSVLGELVWLVVMLAGVPADTASRIVALLVLAVTIVLAVTGNRAAMRVPPTKQVDVTIPGLGRDLDGLRVVVLADTHYGPINRVRWSEGVARSVNALDPDVVCHAGDLADGSVEQRREQVAPLGTIRATMAKLYITGNHEYFSGAQDWLDHMTTLGWQPLHNRHEIIRRGDARLTFAGIDDPTGTGSGLPGHGPDIAAALAGAPEAPTILLAHQPKQVEHAVAAGVQLQISGHTHGGQIWPFHLIVRLEQSALAGLTRHNGRTQLYTSRGTGFWGPPFRVFAPNEITLLILRAPH